MCWAKVAQADHHCRKNVFSSNCPICAEFLFDSRGAVQTMLCGHAIHCACFRQLCTRGYRCPICSKSVGDMSTAWQRIDREVAETPMPEHLRNRQVYIHCNDCGHEGSVLMHVVGLKCPNAACGSYNTRQIGEGAADAGVDQAEEGEGGGGRGGGDG